MIGELYTMKTAERHTMNVDDGGDFECFICGNFLPFTAETEWCECVEWGKCSGNIHMHGTEPFHFCPNCGRVIVTLDEWVRLHPEDQGKTLREIRKRYI